MHLSQGVERQSIVVVVVFYSDAALNSFLRLVYSGSHRLFLLCCVQEKRSHGQLLHCMDFFDKLLLDGLSETGILKTIVGVC